MKTYRPSPTMAPKFDRAKSAKEKYRSLEQC